ncbi:MULTISPECIES: aldehyde dehydrogenase [unclassified Acidovorax]|uniref:aldehyde dehydrogenase n=1 Tax=unclassified Acidovorax TaxID=2684926 RepID=UPI000BC6F51A|nr:MULTISPECIES: aldehyde dehydrogenase [unclassified Acidovorax]OZA57938.1 MAG: aldehyde dehydrogenase [Acidovorax sp. 17-64-282]HQS65477.1 aldehyde dehydrogenase [Acidovorax defluvii]OYY26102.1 MAG: aldehyde dehydrogenase [Acidovorax sp. 35-64-16]OYY85271.1 MAG: aldehyde dehydrogenase [Acidovorax sp. 28-64-14]OZA67492.1 MAG: aldehyde dehydrogenase [Acidovorax sp. 39-64-12]
MVTDYRNYINGQFLPCREDSMIEVRNPATHELLARVPNANDEEIEQAVQAARRAQSSWAKLPAIQRAQHLRAIAAKLRDNREMLAQTITREQGKVLGLARVEVDFTADYMDYMAEWARRIEGEVINSDRSGESIFLLRKPIGVAVGILPWNFPFLLIARKLAPALVTGNTIVIKPSEITPINAFLFAELAAQTDLPAGVFNLVSGTGARAGTLLTSHPDVDVISFTGSVETGTRIMAAASRNLTRVNLELGGKAPAIVLADADLDLAAKAIYDSRVINTGQVCNCAERVYVQRPVAQELIDKIIAHMKATTYGDPVGQPDVMMGPLVSEIGLNKVAGLVDRARIEGAEVALGGRRADRSQGYHYEPTVILGCKADMEIMRKEIFGPVLPIQVVDDLDEAIALANDSDYGLTSSIFTRDLKSAMRASRDLQFGETYVNREHFEAMQGFHAGRRKSGLGGADGKHGLYEFTATHMIYMQHG